MSRKNYSIKDGGGETSRIKIFLKNEQEWWSKSQRDHNECDYILSFSREDPHVNIWNKSSSSWTRLKTLVPEKNFGLMVSCLQLIIETNQLVTCLKDYTIRIRTTSIVIWSLSTFLCTKKIETQQEYISALFLTLNSKYLVTFRSGKKFEVWNVKTWENVSEKVRTKCQAYLPNNKDIVFDLYTQTVTKAGSNRYKSLKKFVKFSQNLQLIFKRVDDQNTLKCFTCDGTFLKANYGKFFINRFVILSSLNEFIYGTEDWKVNLIDMTTGTRLKQIGATYGHMHSLTLLTNRNVLLCSTSGGRVHEFVLSMSGSTKLFGLIDDESWEDHRSLFLKQYSNKSVLESDENVQMLDKNKYGVMKAIVYNV